MVAIKKECECWRHIKQYLVTEDEECWYTSYLVTREIECESSEGTDKTAGDNLDGWCFEPTPPLGIISRLYLVIKEEECE